ncbi:hypothetical protein [Streptomyces sp. TR02-1]|uniref:hypothetical protein n=1 Tax=Streptomyces sp. TR02-1 TaxID=3385977 RepID=UPI0039A0A269
MAVMLTQWSPVPWSGETVSRPSPPPAEGTAPTPIYESLVREWARAGRAVPGGLRGDSGASGMAEVGRWPAEDRAPHPYGVAPGAFGSFAEAVPAQETGTRDVSGAYGRPARHLSAVVQSGTQPHVSGYGDGGGEGRPDGWGYGEGSRSDRAAGSGGASPGRGGETSTAQLPDSGAASGGPAWERVRIL